MTTENEKTRVSKNTSPESKTSLNLDEIVQEAEKLDINQVAPKLGSPPLEKTQIENVLARLAHRNYLTPITAFCSIALLFLKGAASKTAPDRMFVEVRAIDGNLSKVTKGDLMQAYYEVTQNRFIRRLAESLAVQISNFAERHNMKGDLAMNLEIEEISEGREPLTAKEQAWANSFCQNVKNLETLSSARLRQLLNKDYQLRFDKKKKKKVNKEIRKGQRKTDVQDTSTTE